jgi:hypothetical protein
MNRMNQQDYQIAFSTALFYAREGLWGTLEDFCFKVLYNIFKRPAISINVRTILRVLESLRSLSIRRDQ